jgi:quinolinate synthase
MDEARLKEDVRRLAAEKKAIILAHNYQIPAVQDVADLTGDSLELSIKAAATEAEIVVFCGVNFMAESASVLCPDKLVLLAHPSAGCPMADRITAPQLLARRKELGPDVPVVTYVNSTAEVKAESDICCTSANVVSVVRSLASPRVLMTPDRNLGLYAARHTDKELLLWPGCCPIHDGLTADDVREAKARHPGAPFVAHPECRPEVLDLADAIRSTTGMLAFCRESKAKTFIIGTEEGLLYPLRRDNPGKLFVSASPKLVCPDMKKTGLADVMTALETGRGEVKVPEIVASRARRAIERMLAVPRD